MKDDLKRLGVRGQHHKVGKTSVEGLSGLVGSLLQLYHLTKGGQQMNAASANTPCVINSIIRKQFGVLAVPQFR